MAKVVEREGLFELENTEEGLDASLSNADILPTPIKERTWNKWHIASLWVGMSVCIPTYMLAAQMIMGGLSWKEALMMILLGNIIVAIPMIFNGHAGTKYGIPFPVLGRASFGFHGIQIPSLLRALVACGWFGIQTWLGGLAFVAIAGVVLGNPDLMDSFAAQFAGFILFWFINMYFVWKGTESIRVLETLAAPILILIGALMLWWGVSNAGGFAKVLDSSNEFSKPTVVLTETGSSLTAQLNLLKDESGKVRAQNYRSIFYEGDLDKEDQERLNAATYVSLQDTLTFPATEKDKTLAIQFKGLAADGKKTPESSVVSVQVSDGNADGGTSFMTYLLWLTAMVAFWATLALNIPDITRYAKSQKDQAIGQFLGLPTTMVLYSFIGVAVTCAAIIIFDDLLITADAPWDPVRLLARFDDQPVLLIFAQLGLLIATLSTNIAANVISPANSFANLYPEKISFRMGGYITGILGILIMPWKLLGLIIGFLLTYGAILGPVVGILLADYFVVNKKDLALEELYQKEGRYRYANGWNPIALLALGAGIILVLLGMFIPALKPLYDTGWFVGFGVSFAIYATLQKKPSAPSP
jgi:cytosine/uracil/thiamine/allantoin permease